MIEWLSINPHLLPVFAIFIVGLFLMFVCFTHIGIRTKTYIFAPFVNIARCNKLEKKYFKYGAILASIGFFCMILIIQIVGYKYIEIDAQGNKKIKDIKARYKTTKFGEDSNTTNHSKE